MKARIATMASLAGVLVAGSAAAMVNSQVLHNEGVAKNSVQNVAPLTVDTGSPTASSAETPETVVVESTDPPATEPTESSEPTTTVAAGGTRARYRIGDAGDVLVDTAHDRLTVVSTSTSRGWRVTSVRATDSLNSVVTFQSATRRVVFHASLLFGVVGYSVTTYDLTRGGAPVTTEQRDPAPNTSAVTSTTDDATPTVTTEPRPTSPPTTEHDRPRPGSTTTEPEHHSGDPGAPSTTTPRWGSGNGEDD